MRKRWWWSGVIACAAILLTGCGADAMSESEVEDLVRVTLMDQGTSLVMRGLGAKGEFDCEEIAVREGAIADCEAAFPDGGDTTRIRMTMVDDEGHFELDFQ